MASEPSRTSFSLSSKLLEIYQRLEKRGSICKSLNLATPRRSPGPIKNFENYRRLPWPITFGLPSEYCTEHSFLTFANTFCVVRADAARLAQGASVYSNVWPMMNFGPFLMFFYCNICRIVSEWKNKKSHRFSFFQGLHFANFGND